VDFWQLRVFYLLNITELTTGVLKLMDAEARKEYMKQYRKNNKEKIKELNRKWCETNPEKKKEHARKYKTRNRDAINAKNREYYQITIEHQKERNKVYQETHREQVREKSRRWLRNNPEKAMLGRAKSRAKKRGIEFNLTLKDIHIPPLCPIFGIPLSMAVGRLNDNSPSLDRIDNNRGYIPGNVVVISQRANQIKNDGTADEHRRIADYMSSYGYDV
jgi:hypothetical protein